MNKLEIKSALETTLTHSDISEIKETVSALIRDFYSIYNEEKSQLEQKEKAGEEIIVDEIDEQLNESIFKLIESYKNKIAEQKKAIVEEEKKNLTLKKELIEEFSKLVESEENLSKLFGTIKDIREKWNEIGNISRDAYHDIQAQFSRLNEDFNYNVGIYKELQDHDLKRNYSLKNQIIHQVKELLDEKEIKGLDKKIKNLQDAWEEIGPTYKEHWEKLKEDYWNAVKEVYTKIKSHYEEKKNELQANLDTKLQLIEKAKEVVANEAITHQDWEKLSKELSLLQEEWKKTGFVPKEVGQKIWEEFRSIFNEFYDKKSIFFDARNAISEKNKALKKELIDKVGTILSREDFKNSTKQIIQLQKDWKTIGHAGKFAEQKLWKEFRAQCDKFFATMDEHYKKQDLENEGNLKLKEALIDKIKAYQPKEKNKETIKDLQSFSSEFNEIGNVPLKEKDKIYKNYKAALDEKYNALDMDKEEKEKVLLEAKIESIKGSADPIKLFREEKEKIRKRINDLTKEVTNYENNLGFFSNSKGAEKLLKGVHDNIEKGRGEIEKLKQKLKLFPKES